MDVNGITLLIGYAGLAAGLIGILLRIRQIFNRPQKMDLSRPRGSARRGVLYAFTLGMAPWEKESTRQHWISYIRGILFHVGTFTAFAVFFAGPWLEQLPGWLTWAAVVITLAGALLGFAGIWMRLSGPNERMLSVPDDYFSVFLTSLFALLAAVTILVPAVKPVFYVLTGLLGVYIPLSKIRHCVYFFYSKFFFGRFFGHRGVLGQPDGGYHGQ